MKKYTYHDWLEGKLILNYDCYIPSGKKPTLVKWEDFTDEDVLLIKEKQKEIFDERVISLLEKYKSAFQKDISASLDYEGLCNHTVNGIISILTDEMPIGWKSEEVIRTELWDIGFTGEYLFEIKKAYKYGIMKGELHYDFINSPNRDYQQSPDDNPQIYVRSMSSFKIWIESLSFQQAETETECENNFTRSTIDDWLFEFKKQMSETDYQNLVSALMQYFENGIFPNLPKPIQINGRPNKKLFMICNHNL